MAGGGQVGGGRPQALPVGALAAARVGVGGAAGGPVDAGGEDDVRGLAVGAEPGGALAQQAAVPVGGVEQVVEEFAPYPLFGLARRAAGEQQQGGDQGGALQGALVDRVEVGPAVQDEGAQGLAARGDRGEPVVALADGVAPARRAEPAPASVNSTVPPRTSETARATSWTPPPCRTSSERRSWTSEARSMTPLCSRMMSLARSSSARAERVSARRLAVSMATAACAAKEPSSATCSRSKTLALRSAANSTPMTWLPRLSGTPRMATRPSSRTAVSIVRVCWKRASSK